MKIKKTPEQQECIDWWKLGKGHATLSSVAGSGKSTTIQMTVLAALEDRPDLRYLCSAFNVHNKEDLLKKGLRAQTLNSVGYSICRALRPGQLTVDSNKYYELFTQAFKEQESTFGNRLPWEISPTLKLFHLLRNSLQPFQYDPAADLILEHDIGIELETLPALIPILRMVDGRGERKFLQQGLVDFSDQIVLPCRLAKPQHFPYYELIAVDEAQDLSPAIMKLMLMHMKPQTRFLVVFDQSQAIMGFTGAKSGIIGGMLKDMSPTELSLTVSWRCPHAVVSLAKSFVPEFSVPDNANVGQVIRVREDKVTELLAGGELVVCRTNAPLVDLCLKLLSEGKPAQVRGRNFCNAIIALMKKLEQFTKSLGKKLTQKNFSDMLRDYKQSECRKYTAQGSEQAMIAMLDRFDSIEVLFHSLPPLKPRQTVRAALVELVDTLFEDTEDSKLSERLIQLSSIHRAKGLEAETVVIWQPHLLPHPMAKSADALVQEANLEYIAITRTKNTLIMTH